MLKIKTRQILIEDMIVAEVIAILAIATKPEKHFGTSVGFEPKQDSQSVLKYVRYLFYWQIYSLLQENQNWDDPSYLHPILNVCKRVF